MAKQKDDYMSNITYVFITFKDSPCVIQWNSISLTACMHTYKGESTMSYKVPVNCLTLTKVVASTLVSYQYISVCLGSKFMLVPASSQVY